MKDEVILVLNMLKEERISVEEATQLLEVITVSNTNVSGKVNSRRKRKRFDEDLSKFSDSVKTLAKDFGKKIEATYKEIEPKIKSVSKTVVNKTAEVVDNVSKSLSSDLDEVSENLEELNKELENDLDRLEREKSKAESASDVSEENKSDNDLVRTKEENLTDDNDSNYFDLDEKH